MKKKITKKTLSTVSQRNRHKRKSKARAEAELMRAVMETGVGVDALKITSKSDRGRRGQVSAKMRSDETVSRGIFSSSKSGFGFVALEDGSCDRDIFIPEDKTGGAIDGDLVEIIYHRYTTRFGEEKTEGRVKKIVEYGRKTVIGTVEAERFLPRSRRYAR